MSRYHHNDLGAEQVAKVWHQIGEVVSVIATVAGVGIALTSAAGIFWHRWAVEQHQAEIDSILSKETTCQSSKPPAES